MVPGLSAELEGTSECGFSTSVGLTTESTEYRARLKKNPPAQKPPSPTAATANKGKGKATGAKGKARPSNGQVGPGNEETPYSGSDIGDEEAGVDTDIEGNVEDEMNDADLVEDGQDDDNDEPADAEDQMEVDESDSERESRGKE
jgi:hypothetical protein